MGTATLYHVSQDELPAGTVLLSRWYVGHDDHMLLVASQALEMGHAALRLLLLVDDMIRFSRRVRGQEWPDPVNFPLVVREVIFEMTRAREYGDRPRRIGGVFLFPDLEGAERFRAETRKGTGIILECSADSTHIFHGDMALVQNPDLHGDVEKELRETEQRARTYWRGHMGSSAWPEVITNAPVEVVGKVG